MDARDAGRGLDLDHRGRRRHHVRFRRLPGLVCPRPHPWQPGDAPPCARARSEMESRWRPLKPPSRRSSGRPRRPPPRYPRPRQRPRRLRHVRELRPRLLATRWRSARCASATVATTSPIRSPSPRTGPSSTRPDDRHRPPRFRARGRPGLPADKSIAHRTAILAALASGESEIVGFSDAADPQARSPACAQLGVEMAGARRQPVHPRSSAPVASAHQRLR